MLSSLLQQCAIVVMTLVGVGSIGIPTLHAGNGTSGGHTVEEPQKTVSAQDWEALLTAIASQNNTQIEKALTIWFFLSQHLTAHETTVPFADLNNLTIQGYAQKLLDTSYADFQTCFEACVKQKLRAVVEKLAYNDKKGTATVEKWIADNQIRVDASNIFDPKPINSEPISKKTTLDIKTTQIQTITDLLLETLTTQQQNKNCQELLDKVDTWCNQAAITLQEVAQERKTQQAQQTQTRSQTASGNITNTEITTTTQNAIKTALSNYLGAVCYEQCPLNIRKQLIQDNLRDFAFTLYEDDNQLTGRLLDAIDRVLLDEETDFNSTKAIIAMKIANTACTNTQYEYDITNQEAQNIATTIELEAIKILLQNALYGCITEDLTLSQFNEKFVAKLCTKLGITQPATQQEDEITDEYIEHVVNACHAQLTQTQSSQEISLSLNPTSLYEQAKKQIDEAWGNNLLASALQSSSMMMSSQMMTSGIGRVPGASFSRLQMFRSMSKSGFFRVMPATPSFLQSGHFNASVPLQQPTIPSISLLQFQGPVNQQPQQSLLSSATLLGLQPKVETQSRGIQTENPTVNQNQNDGLRQGIMITCKEALLRGRIVHKPLLDVINDIEEALQESGSIKNLETVKSLLDAKLKEQEESENTIKETVASAAKEISQCISVDEDNFTTITAALNSLFAIQHLFSPKPAPQNYATEYIRNVWKQPTKRVLPTTTKLTRTTSAPNLLSYSCTNVSQVANTPLCNLATYKWYAVDIATSLCNQCNTDVLVTALNSATNISSILYALVDHVQKHNENAPTFKSAYNLVAQSLDVNMHKQNSPDWESVETALKSNAENSKPIASSTLSPQTKSKLARACRYTAPLFGAFIFGTAVWYLSKTYDFSGVTHSLNQFAENPAETTQFIWGSIAEASWNGAWNATKNILSSVWTSLEKLPEWISSHPGQAAATGFAAGAAGGVVATGIDYAWNGTGVTGKMKRGFGTGMMLGASLAAGVTAAKHLNTESLLALLSNT